MNVDQLNIEEEMLGQLVQKIFQHAERKGVRENILAKQKEGIEIVESLKRLKNSLLDRFLPLEQLILERMFFDALQHHINQAREKKRRRKKKTKKRRS